MINSYEHYRRIAERTIEDGATRVAHDLAFCREALELLLEEGELNGC